MPRGIFLTKIDVKLTNKQKIGEKTFVKKRNFFICMCIKFD